MRYSFVHPASSKRATHRPTKHECSCFRPFIPPPHPRYTIELRREPFGTRLRQRKKPNPRDMTEWEQFDPVKGFFAYPEPMPGE